jgi:hypothetical protein
MDGVEAPKPRRQDPSRDFVNVWQEIGQSRVYVPQKQVPSRPSLPGVHTSRDQTTPPRLNHDSN